VAGKPFGVRQNRLDGLEGGSRRLEGLLGNGPAGRLSCGLESRLSCGLEVRLGCGLLVASDLNVNATVAAAFGPRSANDAGPTAVDFDSFGFGLNGLNGLSDLDGGGGRNNETFSGRFESGRRGGAVFDLPQFAGVVVVAVLALNLAGGVPERKKIEIAKKNIFLQKP
jgi:hypothetical protein